MIAVAETTTITTQNTPAGKIDPADGAARMEDGGGTVPAVVRPHAGHTLAAACVDFSVLPRGHIG